MRNPIRSRCRIIVKIIINSIEYNKKMYIMIYLCIRYINTYTSTFKCKFLKIYEKLREYMLCLICT